MVARPATLAELVRQHAGFSGSRLAHLSRLVASWGPLADLCFADLLLFVPVAADPERFVVAGQIRPSTSQTVYHRDLVGQLIDLRRRPVLSRAYERGEIARGEIEGTLGDAPERLQIMAIPVRWEGEVVAVCSRESTPSVRRRTGELERTYLAVFARFAEMLAAGTFPFAVEDAETDEAPRVGDGVLVLDGDARVTFASPNAVSALHRLGVHANTQGRRLGELGLQEMVVRTSFAIGAPVTEEIERGPDVTVLLRCLPLIERGRAHGALVLARDVSDLRRRDRLLVSMDATIREIHHRVKNNLQTVSSLLRLQARRLPAAEARLVIDESVRRIHSIAVVHEILSKEPSEAVPFEDIVGPLVRMVEEGLLDRRQGVGIEVTGGGGRIPARVATPLAVVLTELLQNAVEHAFPDLAHGDRAVEGRVRVELDGDHSRFDLVVLDNGVGPPAGLDIGLAQGIGLGLSLVRNLVTSQLGGTIDLRPATPGSDRPGTRAEVSVPLAGGL